MKNLIPAIVLALQFIIIFPYPAPAQDKQVLKFTDNTEKQITNGFFDKKIVSLKAVEREIIATYDGMGKAVRIILGNLPNKAKRENKKLLKNLNAVTTAYNLTQGAGKFYINGFNSVDDEKLRDCNECKVRCKLVLLEIRTAQSVDYIPLIASIKKI